MARRPRDYQAEYARRRATARRRGFESPYAETFVRRLSKRTARGTTLSEALRDVEREDRAHKRLKRQRDDTIGGRLPHGWFTLPIWIIVTATEPSNISERLESRIPVNPATGTPCRYWIPELPDIDYEIYRDDFTDVGEVEAYISHRTAPVVWWLWPKQLGTSDDE